MTYLIQNEMAVFASRYNLTPSEAVFLPALFEKAAKEMGMDQRQLIATATYTNNEAGEYLASVARDVALEAA